jgi:diguanylate cyclase (GGDEF)-like protein
LAIHYLASGANQWFLGATPRSVRKAFSGMIAAEMTLAPFTLAIVLAHQQSLALVILLGLSALLFAGIFRRWALARDQLRRRIVELSVVNEVGRAISTSRDHHTMLVALAKQAARLLDSLSIFMVGLTDEDGRHVSYEIYDSAGNLQEQLQTKPGVGLTGWVMRNRRPLSLGELSHEYRQFAGSDDYNDPRFQSWMGAPLIIGDDVVGVLSTQSELQHAFHDDDMRILTIIADQTAVALENSRLYHLATVDALTGLFVRRYFDQRLGEEWHRWGRFSAQFTVGLVDLDSFKALNDRYGHGVGDMVLRAAGRVLRKNMRHFDVAARYGGEEFVFMLPRASLEEGAIVAERIREDIEALRFDRAVDARVTCSIGVAATGAEVDSVDALLGRADQAMYAAKRAGKNRVVHERTGSPPGVPLELSRAR